MNLLAVPPNPTVIVGSAHCTYLCKDIDKNGVTLPPCCCVTRVKCGTGSVAVEIDGSNAEIICGEWQTGTTSQNVGGEEYNVVLPILHIIRSPAFDAKNLGPGGGGDIAVFKVDNKNLENLRKNRIFPACLPPRGRSTPVSGVHSGQTKPPPLSLRFGSGFLPFSAGGVGLLAGSAFAGLQTLSDVGQVQQIISLLLDDSETFQDFGEQHWQWEAELLLGQSALLLSARHGPDNAASLVSTEGEGLSAQDHVRFKPFSALGALP